MATAYPAQAEFLKEGVAGGLMVPGADDEGRSFRREKRARRNQRGRIEIIPDGSPGNPYSGSGRRGHATKVP
jgi:hypothetical protein